MSWNFGIQPSYTSLVIIALVVSIGMMSCQPGSPEISNDNPVQLDLAEDGTKNPKYFTKLTDLLTRYYEVLGIDYEGSAPTWKSAFSLMKQKKLSVSVHTMIEGDVRAIEKVLQKRMVSHSASPSNTFFMPINLLVGLIRAYAEAQDVEERCIGKDKPCQFARQIFMRFVRDNRMCIDTQKRTQPSTDYYRLYRGLVDYLKVDLGIEEKPARIKAMEFLDTYILPIYLAALSTSLATYRWTTKPDQYYPPDLIVIEEFVANGPPHDSDPNRAVSLTLLNRFYRYAKSFWDNKVIIDNSHPSTTREVFSTIKSIATDIRHLR